MATALPISAEEKMLRDRIVVLEAEIGRHRMASLTARLHLAALDLGGTDGRIVALAVTALKAAAENATVPLSDSELRRAVAS